MQSRFKFVRVVFARPSTGRECLISPGGRSQVLPALRHKFGGQALIGRCASAWQACREAQMGLAVSGTAQAAASPCRSCLRQWRGHPTAGPGAALRRGGRLPAARPGPPAAAGPPGAPRPSSLDQPVLRRALRARAQAACKLQMTSRAAAAGPAADVQAAAGSHPGLRAPAHLAGCRCGPLLTLLLACLAPNCTQAAAC